MRCITRRAGATRPASEQGAREFELALPLRVVAHEPATENQQGEPDGARDQTHGQPQLPHMILVLVVLRSMRYVSLMCEAFERSW